VLQTYSDLVAYVFKTYEREMSAPRASRTVVVAVAAAVFVSV